MRVRFHYHERVLVPLRAWIDDVSAREPNGAIIAETILADIRQRLLESGGELPQAIRDDVCRPPLYWWRYASGFWISYVIRDEGIWRWRTRRVIVYSVGEPPPARVAGAAPRG